MISQQAVNRVERELSQWRSREDRFSKLFSFSLSSNRPLLREKLHYYERVAARYQGTNDPDEQFALRVLRQERRGIEKQLYPNLLTRLLRRLLVTPVRKQALIRRDIRSLEENGRSLQDQLHKAGFSNLMSKLDNRIRQGEQQFTIPVSYYVNERERMDHELNFTRDPTGQYHFHGFKARLYDQTQPSVTRQHYFMAEQNMNANLVFQLLEGRSIQKDDRWLQLDFNDKDAQGNNRLKEFPSSFGYDLEKVVKDLPLKELVDRGAAYHLLDKLKQGSREAVSFLQDGKEHRYYIEANHQFKTINIYDEDSRKISLSAATGKKTGEALKVTHQVNQQKVHSKRNGVKMVH